METARRLPRRRLELSQTNGDMFDNYDIVFVDDSPGGDLPAVRAKVTNVPEGMFDAWPYEPNESRTFRAELASFGELLAVAITTSTLIHKAGEKVYESTFYGLSSDGGRTWETISYSEFPVRVPVTAEGGQALSRIAGPNHGGRLTP